LTNKKTIKKTINGGVLFVEGPDRCGKTHIAKALAEKYSLEYWRNDNVDDILRYAGPGEFKKVLQYYYSQMPLFAKMLQNRGSGLVIDRCYITEWVYSNLFNRATDLDVIQGLEQQYMELGGVIIYCYKTDYMAFHDEFVKEEQIKQIKDLYRIYFEEHAKMPILWLDTSHEDLTDQLMIIDRFLKSMKERSI